MNLKKILTGVVAGAMAVSAVSVSAFAAEDVLPPTDWGTPVEIFNESALKDLENVDKLYEGELTVTFALTVTEGHEWQNGTAVVRGKDANGDYDWNEMKFGGTSCVGNEWFPDGSYVIADDAKTFEFSVKADLTDKEGLSVCLQSGNPDEAQKPTGVFAVTSVTLENEAGFKAVYADGKATVPSEEKPEEPGIELVDVEITANETNSAPLLNVDGGKVRLNIVHPWSDGKFVFADSKAFVGYNFIQVTVTVTGVKDSFTAQIQGMDGSNTAFSVWGDAATDLGKSDVVTIDKDGTYTLTLTAADKIPENGSFFLMVGTDLAAVKDADDNEVVPEGLVMTLDKLSVGIDTEALPAPADPEETDPEETDPEETDPEETDPEATNPEDTSAAAAGTGDSTPTGTGDNNQPTGIAIAFVPAVLAATGIIVAKKRK